MRADLAIAALCFIALTGCERMERENPETAVSTTPPEVGEVKKPPEVVDPAKAALICKAGIARLFQQPAATMKAERLAEGITRISYRRSSDNTLWKNDCRLEDNRIVWRAVDASPGSGPGRWRDDPADGTVTYKVIGDRIEVTETF